MMLFELIFGLSAIVLGLALTNIVTSLHRLALVRQRVRWAPEPLLLTLLITLIIVQIWLNQWNSRTMAETGMAETFVATVRLMTIYFAAASCLPDPDLIGTENFDLLEYYYDTRALTYGALIVGLLLFALHRVLNGTQEWGAHFAGTLAHPILYAVLAWSRRRWVHLAGLCFMLLVFGSGVLTIKLQG